MTNLDEWWWKPLSLTKEPQFPYVEKCNICAGYGYILLEQRKNYAWITFDHRFTWEECYECKCKGYVIPPEWTSNE